MKKKKSIFEDNFKKIYATDEEGKLIVKFGDEVPQKSPNKTLEVKGKGKINNQIAAFLYQYLKSYHIATNFLDVLSDREMVIQEVQPIPLVVKVYNYVDKELADRFDLEEESPLNSPISEYFLKDSYCETCMVNQTHLQALGILSGEEFRLIERLTAKINAILRSFFQRRQLQLIRFQLEFGKLGEKLVITGDLTADFMALADTAEGKLNFKRFQITPNTASDVYSTLQQRILNG